MSKRGHYTPNYMPDTEAKLIDWLSRFLNNLLPLLGLLEIDKEETYDPLVEDLGMVRDTRSCIDNIDTIRPALTDTKDEQLFANDLYGEVVSPREPGRIFPAFGKARKSLVKRVDLLVRNIKNHRNYTESIGRELGIIAPEPPPVDYAKVRSHGHDEYDGGNQLALFRTIAHGCDGYKIWLNIDHAPQTKTLYEIKTQQTRAGKLVGVATTSSLILQQGMPVKHLIPKGAEETATP
jgi:hypothetical protein